MSTIYVDIAQPFDFVYRAGNDGTAKITALNSDATDFDFTGYTSQYIVFSGGSGAVISTHDATIVGNLVTVTFTETDNADKHTYRYEWRFTNGTTTQTWFAGAHKIISGNPLSSNDTGNSITATIYTSTPEIVATVSNYELPDSAKYTVLITQTGTNAPSPTVLANGVGTLTWSYVNVGRYKLSIAGGFNTSATFVSVPIGVALYLEPNYLKVTFDVDNNLLFETKDATVEYANGILSKFNFEVRTY